MTIKNLIGISGAFTSGKTTLAEGLVELDPRYKVVGLADQLKLDVYCMVNRVEGPVPLSAVPTFLAWVNENKTKLRTLLQVYGETCREIHGEDYWIERLVQFVQNRGYEHVIVSDARHPNEVEGLRERSDESYFVRLLLPLDVQKQRYEEIYGVPPSTEQLAHPSERALDGYIGFDGWVRTDLVPPRVTLAIVRDALINPHRDIDFTLTQEVANVG